MRAKGEEVLTRSALVLDDEWEEINITVDSGAVDYVAGKEVGSQFSMKDTATSRKGGYYMAANDTKIYNEGERRVLGYTKEGRKAGMIFQVCKVNGPLGSVRKTVAVGGPDHKHPARLFESLGCDCCSPAVRMKELGKEPQHNA